MKIFRSISLLYFCFDSLFAPSLVAQVHAWPPGGILPAPVTAGMKLPSNRFVPSTKKYNLIWADQLYGQSAGRIEFIAKNYAATQKIWNYQAADYRVYNPNFIVTIYHLANGINPGQNDDCPDPKSQTGSGFIGVVAPDGYVSEWQNHFLPWLNKESIAMGGNAYEQMFQHFTSVDKANRVWHRDPYWVMNLENSDWRKYVSEISLNWMKGNQDEGCFFDVSVETLASSLFHPESGDPAPYHFPWHLLPYGPFGYSISSLNDFSNWMNNQYLKYYQFIYKQFHTPAMDYLVLPNVDQMATGWYDPVWMEGSVDGETIDGAMMESFGNYTESDMYLSLERCVRHITGRGKILIAQFYNNSPEERYRRIGMYMLVKNENSFVNIASGDVSWYPEYEISLGDQSPVPDNLQSLRVAGSGDASLFKRDYQYGMVLCNTSSVPMSYSLTGNNWYKITASGGGSVDEQGMISNQSLGYESVGTTVAVPASDCLILTNNRPASIDDVQALAAGCTVYPQPVQDNFVINIPGDLYGDYEWSIYNSSGILIRRGTIRSHTNRIEISIAHFTNGMYFFRLSGKNFISSIKFLLMR